MSKLPFRWAIIRGVALGAVVLSVMLLGIAMYHRSGASAQPAVAAPAIAPAVEEAPPALASEIAPPDKVASPVVPPPPSIGKRVRPASAPTPQAPAISAAIHEEEAAAPPPSPLPEESAATAEEKDAVSDASPEVPKESPEPPTESAKPKPENRGVRWIKSLGRRLHIGGK